MGEPDEAALTAAVLDRNLFGVDISGPAVEIAKLALWLHSARSDAPLSSLDGAIKCGNSLVGSDYYQWTQVVEFTEAGREQVNAFDWATAFPFEGEDSGLFDIVLGNPPYVKLQNLRQANPDVADYLLAAREGEFYRSTQTGNFDLYLPFIEKGLRLLRPGGRMGYIAPSIWTVAEYGEALRTLVRGGRTLERWVDFKSHQIFAEAITYTALQFFTADANDAVEVTPAPGGESDLAEARADGADRALEYERLPHGEPWLMATGEERVLIDRLSEDCLRLDDPSLTTGIIVGLQTSADNIYHLQWAGTGRYRCTPDDSPAYEVEVEDAIMKPLVSGPEAKRYEEPRTDTYLLFPYERHGKDRMRLIPGEVMADRFPKAWNHLKSYEPQLRGREGGKFDDLEWHRFGRNQNIDKQDLTKLVVAQTVPAMRVSIDTPGDKYLNNVRVNGILAPASNTLFYLLGVLNGPVADYVFRRLGKPKAGGWYEANKQFIAPLPIPNATPDHQAEVGAKARALQAQHTQRRDLSLAVVERLGVLRRSEHRESWLWPDIHSLDALEEDAPKPLRGQAERRDWAKATSEEEVAAKLAALQALLDRPARWDARFADGELRLLAGGASAVDRIYLDEAQGRLTEAYWRWLLLVGAPKEAGKLAEALRRPPADPTAPAAPQFIDKVAELGRIAAEIEAAEASMNTLLFDLYELTPEERRLVERG